MANRKQTDSVSTRALTPAERDKRIAELEARRLELTREIELVVRQYAKESGKKKLARRQKVGKAPNDFSEKL